MNLQTPWHPATKVWAKDWTQGALEEVIMYDGVGKTTIGMGDWLPVAHVSSLDHDHDRLRHDGSCYGEASVEWRWMVCSRPFWEVFEASPACTLEQHGSLQGCSAGSGISIATAYGSTVRWDMREIMRLTSFFYFPL